MITEVITDTAKNVERNLIGGKAYNLIKLKAGGFNVPHFFVIPTSFFDTFKIKSIPQNLINKIIKKRSGTSDINISENYSLYIKKKLFENRIRFNRSLSKSIKLGLDKIDSKYFAVRSSADVEDSKESSYAGQFDSYLNVAPNDIVYRIVCCWASLYNSRAINYFSKMNQDINKASMAVIVQKMIDPDYSGVIFTKYHNNHSDILIEIVKGYGEKLVLGLETPNRFLINRSDIDAIKCEGPNLNFNLATLKMIAKESLKIEEFFGTPQDIEFSLSSNNLFILQTRPITI